MSNGSDMRLRAAETADAADVADIWRVGWADGHLGFVPDALAALRTDESFLVRASERVADTTVATVDGGVVGFVMVVDDEIEQVYVASSYRGTGVADRLLADAERQVAAHGHRRAWLAVVAGNARARAFYERMGWHDDGPFDYTADSHAGPIVVPCHRYTKQLTTDDRP